MDQKWYALVDAETGALDTIDGHAPVYPSRKQAEDVLRCCRGCRIIEVEISGVAG